MAKPFIFNVPWGRLFSPDEALGRWLTGSEHLRCYSWNSNQRKLRVSVRFTHRVPYREVVLWRHIKKDSKKGVDFYAIARVDNHGEGTSKWLTPFGQEFDILQGAIISMVPKFRANELAEQGKWIPITSYHDLPDWPEYFVVTERDFDIPGQESPTPAIARKGDGKGPTIGSRLWLSQPLSREPTYWAPLPSYPTPYPF